MYRLGKLAASKIPFLFVADFEGKEFFVHTLDDLDGIYYEIKGRGNALPWIVGKSVRFEKRPAPFEHYKKAFDAVKEEIKNGNTYLLNLTFPTRIATNLSLLEIFHATQARFKLCYKDRFVCFSPEQFVKIIGNKITTYPMKGTIDASIPNAKEKILKNEKEMAEHVMVVDLLRNDLGIVARDIRVERFRYIDSIKAGKKELLQVSSQISGKLPPDWQSRLGEILTSLLPAGSISGTPKKKTVEIIKRVEGHERGFFTGVFGIFDGENLESAVMIRYIEKTPEGLVYKSGGGITIDSDAKAEYQEMIDKVYLPNIT